MSNSFYNAARDALLDASQPFDVEFYRDVLMPCRHRWWTRLADRLRGRYHPQAHLVTERFVRIGLLDRDTATDGEEIHLTYDANGIFRLD